MHKFHSFILSLLCCQALNAQVQTTPETKPTKETAQQTYQRALKESYDKDPGKRHRALLVLATYSNESDALEASCRLLNDKVEKVRQTAVVNLSNLPYPIRQRCIMFFDAEPKVIALLADKNIQIQRLAASNLMPYVLRSSKIASLPQLKKTLTALVTSKDAYLKEAAIKNFNSLRTYLPEISVASLFENAEDKNLKLASANLMYQLTNQKDLNRAAAAIAAKGKKDTRRIFLNNILNKRPLHRQSAAAAFAQDKDPNAFTLGRIAAGLPTTDMAQVQKYIQQGLLSRDTTETCFALFAQKKEFFPILLESLESKHIIVRSSAVHSCGRSRIEVGRAQVLKLIADSSKEVRKKTQQNLVPRSLDKSDIDTLMSLDNPEAMLSASNLMGTLKDCGEDAEHLMTLLMADDEAVRARGLFMMMRLRLPDRLDFIERAFDDESKTIRRLAGELLYRENSPESRALLQKLLKEVDESL